MKNDGVWDKMEHHLSDFYANIDGQTRQETFLSKGVVFNFFLKKTFTHLQ